MTFLVSVVLPVHNGQLFLEKSIYSCLNQSYKNLELIIVDDASTDSTPRIINQFKLRDPRIKVITHKKNQKLPGALNSGLRLVKGDFVTWTSDDNEYYSEALVEMVNFLTLNPQFDMVYTGFEYINNKGKIIEQVFPRGIENIFYYNVIGPCFLYSNKVYKLIGNYSDQLFLAEDYDYWLRVNRIFKIGALNKILYKYRIHENSLSSRNQKEAYIASELAINTNLTTYANLSNTDLCKIYITLVGFARSRMDFEKMRFYISKAFEYGNPMKVMKPNIFIEMILGRRIRHVILTFIRRLLK